MVRCFEDTDWPGFLKFMTDPAATRHLLFSDDMKSEDGARALFESTIESYSTDDPIHAYAVALKNNRFIGSCGFSPIDEVAGLYECFYTLLPRILEQRIRNRSDKSPDRLLLRGLPNQRDACLRFRRKPRQLESG